MTLEARRLGDNLNKLSLWCSIFDETITNEIVRHTNIKLAVVRVGLSATTNKTNYKDTDPIEVHALIGLLLLSSVLKCNNETITSLFAKDPTNRPYFNAAMSIKRYQILLPALRFDEAATRQQRKANDKAAPITDIFNKVIKNSQKMYCPSEHVTVDEMLVPFRGRCSFRMYLPKKPHK